MSKDTLSAGLAFLLSIALVAGVAAGLPSLLNLPQLGNGSPLIVLKEICLTKNC